MRHLADHLVFSSLVCAQTHELLKFSLSDPELRTGEWRTLNEKAAELSQVQKIQTLVAKENGCMVVVEISSWDHSCG